MMQFMLQCKTEASNEACGLCHEPVSVPAGTRLALAGTSEPVCPACARKHAPEAAALLALGDAATRVSKIGRHSVFPPLTSLLDLASAAEQYSTLVQQPPPSSAAG
jgi:hypothetical protein